MNDEPAQLGGQLTKYKTFQKVNQLIEWGRYNEAIREAEELLRQYPEDPDTYATLAVAYRTVDPKKALYWSGETLKRDPENEDAWRAQLFVAYDAEDWKTFKWIMPDMLRMFPERAYLHALQGNYLMKHGKLAEAQIQVEEAMRIQELAEYFSQYSYLLALQGDNERSRQAERSALREDPDNETVLMQLAWAADTRNDAKAAIEYMSAAVRLDPANEQLRKEYLEMLQKSYWFYRVLMLPNFLRRMKGWQILLLWFVCWALFKPLLILFIVLYILSYWVSKWLVNVKVFGWGGIFRGR